MGDESTDPRVGQILQDRYRIVDVIDEGATGTVYRGERLRLGRTVAIKFLHKSIASDKAFMKRFEREALAMSRLGHPHCVSVLDFGVDGGPYIVMDYVTGETLRDLLDRGRVAMPRALHIIRQVLAGLAHAHRQGIVHRDIKPANVMLTEATGTGDHARILDFGLATLRDSGASGDVSESWIIVGTPAYMSPEQSMGEKVDARGDIYSVGVMLFHLLTGEKPYDAEDAFETLRLHREEKVPKLTDFADLEFPKQLQAIIDRAMAKDPDRRYQTAQEFADALDELAAAGAVPEPLAYATTQAVRIPPRPRRWPILVGGLVVIAAAAAASVWYERRSGRGAAAPVGEPTETDMVALATDAGGAAIAVAPPDAAPAVALGPADASVDDDAGDGGAEDAGVDAMPAVLDLPPDELDEPIAAVADTDDEPEEPGEGEGDDVEPPEPPPSERPVETVADATALIKAGKREQAIYGLRKLRRKYPKSAYVPYLLGNLYFEKMWWTDGLKQYAAAINNNRTYRKRSVLNRNVIRALASDKTKSRAITLVLRKIGRSALPYLRKAAKSDRNKTVRNRSKWLIKKLSKKR